MTEEDVRFGKIAWGVLGYILLVILWGAFVRATGSGAGCGNHWPLCNGEVIPSSPEVETLIEFSHRLTSGIAFLAVVVLVVYAFRLLLASALFMIVLLGASGAVAALGDTLFPSATLEDALAVDFSTGADLLIRLRIYHPIIAILAAFPVLGAAIRIARRRQDLTGPALLAGLLFLMQLVMGLVNLLLMAPVSIQLLHLLTADLVWISLVLLAASTLVEQSRSDSGECRKT